MSKYSAPGGRAEATSSEIIITVLHGLLDILKGLNCNGACLTHGLLYGLMSESGLGQCKQKGVTPTER